MTTADNDAMYRASTLDILRRKGKHGLSGMLESIRLSLIEALEDGKPLDIGIRSTISALRIGEPDVVLSIALIPAKPPEPNVDERENVKLARLSARISAHMADLAANVDMMTPYDANWATGEHRGMRTVLKWIEEIGGEQ